MKEKIPLREGDYSEASTALELTLSVPRYNIMTKAADASSVWQKRKISLFSLLISQSTFSPIILPVSSFPLRRRWKKKNSTICPRFFPNMKTVLVSVIQCYRVIRLTWWAASETAWPAPDRPAGRWSGPRWGAAGRWATCRGRRRQKIWLLLVKACISEISGGFLLFWVSLV